MEKTVKAGVVSLGKAIEAKYGVKVSHQWLLDQTAKHLAGVSHWGVMKETLAAQPEVVERALEFDGSDEESSDYKLREGFQSCWIKVDSIAVYIKREAEGVVVDLHTDKVCEQSLASTWAEFAEAEADFAEFNEIDLDDVAEWVGLHYKVNFDAESPAARSDWLQRYQEMHATPASASLDETTKELLTDAAKLLYPDLPVEAQLEQHPETEMFQLVLVQGTHKVTTSLAFNTPDEWKACEVLGMQVVADVRPKPVILEDRELSAISILAYFTKTNRADWCRLYDRPDAFATANHQGEVNLVSSAEDLIEVILDGKTIWEGPIESAMEEIPVTWQVDSALDTDSLETTYGTEHPTFSLETWNDPHMCWFEDLAYWDWVLNIGITQDKATYVVYSSNEANSGGIGGYWNGVLKRWDEEQYATRYTRKQRENLVFMGYVPNATGFDQRWLEL